MMLTAEVNSTPTTASSWMSPNTGGMGVRSLLGQMLFGVDTAKVRRGMLSIDQNPMAQSIRVGQMGTKASNNFMAGIPQSMIDPYNIALIGLCDTGALYWSSHFLLGPVWVNERIPNERVEFDAPRMVSSAIISPAAKLIDEAQDASGLTLDLIAPLLGVSRRSIQYWKDGEKISVKNELQLRGLVDALKLIATGTADETRDMLLARITGVPRIYDLLAERRYDAAVSRAKSPSQNKPILSDPTVKFSHRPIEDQLAIADDGPARFKGKLNRAGSRRLGR